MANVYILLIERSPTDIRIDSVYSSEKKAWKQVEILYKKMIETISKIYSIDNIQFAEFRGKSLTLVYREYHDELGYIKYSINKRAIY